MWKVECPYLDTPFYDYDEEETPPEVDPDEYREWLLEAEL